MSNPYEMFWHFQHYWFRPDRNSSTMKIADGVLIENRHLSITCLELEPLDGRPRAMCGAKKKGARGTH